ncbi:flagellin FliC, partial [Escherichia coli]|nr:flagellin FliC [Escherichia coli]
NDANKDVFVSAADGSLTTSSDTKVSGESIDATELAKLAIKLADKGSIEYKGITFTNNTGAELDANGKGVLTANIDGQADQFTIGSNAPTGAGATITTDTAVYKNSAGQFTTTKVENKAATLSDL